MRRSLNGNLTAFVLRRLSLPCGILLGFGGLEGLSPRCDAVPFVSLLSVLASVFVSLRLSCFRFTKLQLISDSCKYF